jgi:hypothetical protein
MVLGSHSALSSLGEMSYFDDWVIHNKQCACGKSVSECSLWQPVISQFNSDAQVNCIDIRRQPGDSHFQRIRHLTSIVGIGVLGKLMRPKILKFLSARIYARAKESLRLYELVRAVSGKPIVVDSSKSPHRMAVLYTLQPQATRVIYITRDGRGWMYSDIKRQIAKWGVKPPSQTARKWRRGHHYVRFMSRVLDSRAFLHVRYEEICRQPEKTFERICEFVGVPYEPAMLQFREHEHHNLGGNPLRFRNDSEIVEDQRWREQLKPDELTVFESVSGKLNRRILGSYYVP